MDPYRFDEWTKALVTNGAGTSRRAFLAGVLRAGAAAIGLAAASSQAARADDDDDDDDDDDRPRNTDARCQRSYERCVQRTSFQKCSRCIDELAASGCPVPAPQFSCSCSSDAYCADGNGCTLDICSSNVCYNVPIGNQLSDCTQCRKNRDCPGGGTCCKGRCCPAGFTCQTNELGVGICCETCGDGRSCCQYITTEGSPDSSRGYFLGLGTCQGEEGAPFGLPTFCCGEGGGTGGYQDPSDPDTIFCVLPVRGLP